LGTYRLRINIGAVGFNQEIVANGSLEKNSAYCWALFMHGYERKKL
jgi:hypothetical protein